MLVRQAHEIEWVKKAPNSISPMEREETLKNVCSKENLIFLGFVGEWKGHKTKIRLTCSNNHTWDITINNFHSGKRCPECAMGKFIGNRYIPKEEYLPQIEDICKNEGLTFLGFDDKKGTRKKFVIIECSCGDISSKDMYSFLAGRRCEKCSRKRQADSQRKDKEYYIKQITDQCKIDNSTFLGFIGNFNGYTSKFKVLCCNGHEYTTTMNNFVTHKKRCSVCRGGVALSVQEYTNRIRKICKDKNISFINFCGEWNGSRTKLKLSCHNNHMWVTSIASVFGGSACPSCAEYGYRPSKRGVLYIQKLIKENLFVGVKFGITNTTTQKRMKQQNRKSQFDHEIFYELTLQDGQKILDLENKIKEAMKGKTSYISKEDMPDGYTETVAPSELSTIMYIVKSFEKELTA